MREQIAAVLVAHQPKTGIRDLHQHCTCGWSGEPLGRDFIQHQAEVLAAQLA